MQLQTCPQFLSPCWSSIHFPNHVLEDENRSRPWNKSGKPQIWDNRDSCALRIELLIDWTSLCVIYTIAEVLKRNSYCWYAIGDLSRMIDKGYTIGDWLNVYMFIHLPTGQYDTQTNNWVNGQRVLPGNVYTVNQKNGVTFIFEISLVFVDRFLRFLPFQSETINVYICIKFCHLTLIAMLHYLTESQCTKSQHFLCIFTAKYEVFEHVSHAKQALRWPLTMSEFTQCARNDRYSYEQMLFLSEITGKGQCQWHAKNKNKCKTR